MDIILSIVTPVFGVMLLGYATARLGWFGDEYLRGLSFFVFYFATPPLLLRSVVQVELPPRFPWGFALSFFLSTFAVWGLGMLAVRVRRRAPLDGLAIYGFGTAFGNTVMMGIPLVLTAFGDSASLPLFLIIALHSPLLMTTLTLLVELGRGRRGAWYQVPLATLQGLVRNPIVMGLLLGLLLNLLDWALPASIDAVAAMLAQAALPCALFAMGAALSQYRIAGNLAESCILVGLKILLHPLLVWLLARWVFDVPPLWTSVAVVLAALPNGINGYVFAQRYDTGVATVATMIVISTALSLVTLPLLLVLLQVR